MQNADPLKILELCRGCSIEDVKNNYRRLSKKFHPDKNEGSEEQFRKITEAYKVILDDPSILNLSPKNPTGNNLFYVRTSLSITMEDLYFGKEIYVKINRYIFCDMCNGTGGNICPHCDGTGSIKSSVIDLMQIDGRCPICKGRGIQGKACSKCLGSKYVTDSACIAIRPNIYHYYKKVIKIKNRGNQIGKNQYSDVYINLEVIPDIDIKVEDNYFCTYAKIYSVQKVIGDTGTIKIFGRKLKFEIKRGEPDAYVTDTLDNGLKRTIRIKFIVKEPLLTEETKKLYRKILDIEKRSPKKGDQ